MMYQFEKEIDSSKLQDDLHGLGIPVDHIDTSGSLVYIYTAEELTNDQVYMLDQAVSIHNKNEHTLDDEAENRMNLGALLFKEISKKVWVINTENDLAGHPMSVSDMQSLLATSDQIQKCLESGSFKTAKYVLGSLKSSLPIYASVADYATAEINKYLGV